MTTCNRQTPQIELNTPQLKLLALKQGGGNTDTGGSSATKVQSFVNAVNNADFVSPFNYLDLSGAEYAAWWAEYYAELAAAAANATTSTTITQGSYLVKKDNRILCVKKDPPPYTPLVLPTPPAQSQPLSYKGYLVSKGAKYKVGLLGSSSIDLYPYIPPQNNENI